MPVIKSRMISQRVQIHPEQINLNISWGIMVHMQQKKIFQENQPSANIEDGRTQQTHHAQSPQLDAPPAPSPSSVSSL